jgi:phage replication-related protein YjqB (UPF0714/DUF867 family)
MVQVRESPPDQEDLRDHREHCSVDPRLLQKVGTAPGQQIRLYRSETQFGLYTVSEVTDEQDQAVIRTGLSGRQRLGTDGQFDARLLPYAVDGAGASGGQSEASNEFIEELRETGGNPGLIAIAPHGGDIERHTDDQAERLAARLSSRGASWWRCRGYRSGGDAFATWHITSTDLDERSFPLLASVMSRHYADAVAFHGFDGSEVLVGGAAPLALRESIRASIEASLAGSGIDVVMAGPNDEFGGDDPRNIVNRLTGSKASGVQIEQSLVAREKYWDVIADAVATVYERS